MTAEAGPVSGAAPVTDLVMRAREGDQRAWDAIVERYAPLVWAICRRYRLAGADADDAGQAVWLALVDHIGQIRDPAALPGWLATTTGRECSPARPRGTQNLPLRPCVGSRRHPRQPGRLGR
jgi:DNA-directed RNA polymerase specialized sigma24 family protein